MSYLNRNRLKNFFINLKKYFKSEEFLNSMAISNAEIDNIANTAGYNDNGTGTVNYDFVPRSGGGVMTGNSLGRTVNNSELKINGGTSDSNGSAILLRGKDKTGNGGETDIVANDGTDSTTVNIKPNGTITRVTNNVTKNVAMQEDVVPRSGGAVITGSSLGRTVNNSELQICSGTEWDKGASIILYGKDNAQSYFAGRITLHASDNLNSNNMIIYPNGTLTWNGNYLRPDTDNYCYLGAAQYRYKALYAASGTINTSDARLKNSIKDIDDKLLDAWGNIEPKQYKFNDATEKKGEKARYHTGYLAQDIQAECEKHGVNASDYGLFCYDEWEEQEEISEEIETEKDGKKVKEKHIIQPKREKGNSYALRYTETLVVECAYLRRENTRLKTRLDTLETRLEQLEQSLK